jgi:hypothetical protein
MAVWYSLWLFVVFFPIWYVWTKKNLATLLSSEAQLTCTRQPTPSKNGTHFVRIQKPVATYDLGKFSVTNCARLPNYLKINLLFILYLI